MANKASTTPASVFFKLDEAGHFDDEIPRESAAGALGHGDFEEGDSPVPIAEYKLVGVKHYSRKTFVV